MLKINCAALLAALLLLAPQALASNTTADAGVAYGKIAKGAMVIDVRTAEEFATGHLPQAHNIPYENIVPMLQQLGVNAQQSLVLYCRSGRRADVAKAALEKAGYIHVYNAGGYQQLTTFKAQLN
ncbi:rhodanese-like domain-containing protein [Shewanella sp. YIC-542]|uniref:rhodanese-like domain-containing protein n=1 Tax=Shewanella mytili TaxID=3377111 RepID=UPI00398E3174